MREPSTTSNWSEAIIAAIAVTNFGVYFNGTAGASFADPVTSPQLYRYLAATLVPGLGDGQCNTGNPLTTHICFVDYAEPNDVRFFQSTGPLTLAPGGSGSVVVAYIFAAPVAVNSCTPPCDVRPGDPTILGDAARMSTGVNTIDSLTGYAGFADANGDGRVSQEEFGVVPGSLLGKALVAQNVFDNHFLLPFAPPAPEFFLIPGSDQVTVLWKPLEDAASVDPFFETARSPTVLPPGGGAPVANLLYDPSYRRNDVEGYRVYRGRSPSSLRLIAQYDLAGTFISDFGGLVNPDPGCAPELGIVTACPAPFSPPVPGIARTVSVDYPLVGEVRQVRPGRRAQTADGRALALEVDTALTGGNQPFPPLRDSGVPFVFVDRTVRNDFKYFYAVSAFDLNSAASGPSSLESPRVTRPVTPEAPATNYAGSLDLSVRLFGRGEPLDTGAPMPSLDQGSGRFSGPFPPANDFQVGFAEIAQAVLGGAGTVSVTLDSLRLGSAEPDGTAAGGTPGIYFLSAAAEASTVKVQIPVLQSRASDHAADSVFFPAARLDPAEASRPEYGFLPSSQRIRATLATPGAMFVSQPGIPVPLAVEFPFPAWATRQSERGGTVAGRATNAIAGYLRATLPAARLGDLAAARPAARRRPAAVLGGAGALPAHVRLARRQDAQGPRPAARAARGARRGGPDRGGSAGRRGARRRRPVRDGDAGRRGPAAGRPYAARAA